VTSDDVRASVRPARDTAVAAKGPVGSLGGAWMTGDAEEQATADAGLEGWQLYFLARHGVLGDVDPDVVTAAAVVFPADVVRSQWEAARQVMTPQAALGLYLGLCHAWGREHLGGFDGAGRLAQLATQVVDSADVIGLPLFAGWRAVPRPDDQAARCAHLLQVMREHRGAAHGVALVATGVLPLVAILAGDGGAANAQDYGWEPPFPEVTDSDRAARRAAEELTDDLVAPAYECLDQQERAELLTLLEAAFEHAFGGHA